MELNKTFKRNEKHCATAMKACPSPYLPRNSNQNVAAEPGERCLLAEAICPDFYTTANKLVAAQRPTTTAGNGQQQTTRHTFGNGVVAILGQRATFTVSPRRTSHVYDVHTYTHTTQHTHMLVQNASDTQGFLVCVTTNACGLCAVCCCYCCFCCFVCAWKRHGTVLCWYKEL